MFKGQGQITLLSTLYILISCLLASDRFCFYREDKPEFCTMGAHMFLKLFLFLYILKLAGIYVYNQSPSNFFIFLHLNNIFCKLLDTVNLILSPVTRLTEFSFYQLKVIGFYWLDIYLEAFKFSYRWKVYIARYGCVYVPEVKYDHGPTQV